jgi:ankyrin repeat protein
MVLLVDERCPSTSCSSIEERMQSIDQELFEASGENNLQEVRRLLSVGADANLMDTYYGHTPLHWASVRGHSRVVKAFLEHGADIEVKGLCPLSSSY